jgi:rSAM/selenodomain-associated transferase 1
VRVQISRPKRTRKTRQGCALALFVKYPELGKVKARLAKKMGDERASKIYRDHIEELIKGTRPLSGEYDRVIFYDSLRDRSKYLEWLGNQVRLYPQTGQGLGDRLEHAFRHLLKKYERVIVISSDYPSITAAQLTEAFDFLRENEIVLGPTAEGGFYLIGLKKPYFEIFEQVLWSTPFVFDTVLRVLKGLKIEPYLLPVFVEEESSFAPSE